MDEREHFAEPFAAVSASVADDSLQMREGAFEKKRRPPQPALRLRLLRFWISPRVVMRDALINDVRRFVLLISALVMSAFAATAADEDPTPIGLLQVCAALALTTLLGIVCVYVRSLITGNVCRWLGGDVTNRETRAVLAWAWLPVALVALLLLPRTLAVIAVRMDSPPGLFGALHEGAQAVTQLYDGLGPWFACAALVAVVWALVLETFLLADAAELGKWRAFMASFSSSLLPLGALLAAGALAGGP